MNAAVIHAFDAPPRYATFAEPVAEEGESIVNVSAAGLHPVVKSLANQTHYSSAGVLPLIPGVDGVGRLDDGTRVLFGMARSPFGTFAERSVTARAMCLPLPDALDDVSVAGLMNPGMSSWAALTMRARLVTGESVMVLGATGVAGRLAVQVAKRLGARRVIAVGRDPEALEELPRLGADAVVPLNQESEAFRLAIRRECIKDGLDIVLDYLWGAPAERVLQAISQKELRRSVSRVRFVQVGASAGDTISLPAATLRSSGIELIGSGFGGASIEQIVQSAADFLGEAAKTPFETRIKIAPLRDVEALWNAGESGVRLVFQP